MITECTREVESGKRIRIKARREYSAKIEEFQVTVEGDARKQSTGGEFRAELLHPQRNLHAGGGDGLGRENRKPEIGMVRQHTEPCRPRD